MMIIVKIVSRECTSFSLALAVELQHNPICMNMVNKNAPETTERYTYTNYISPSVLFNERAQYLEITQNHVKLERGHPWQYMLQD